jgi:Ser/Thr protein kinase RdoA (MazF antagonist)
VAGEAARGRSRDAGQNRARVAAGKLRFPAEIGDLADRTIETGGATGVLDAIDAGPAPAWDRIYGAMERVLAGDREVVELVRSAPLERDASQRLVGMIERLMEEGPAEMAALPRQLRHGDCHGGNALVVGDRITGFLDFEVAGPGTQAMDLAHGAYYLRAWCDPPGSEWDHIGAFAGGYGSVVETAAALVAAVPMVAPLLVRWKEGTASEERVRLRAELVMKVDEFFARDGERLSEVLLTSS